MFTPAQINTIARRAHHAIEGKGEGHTVYARGKTAERYIVGGLAPAPMLAIGTPVAAIREAVRTLAAAPRAMYAHTLGYWEERGTLYIDLGDTWADLETALTIARQRGEIAIYDRTAGEAIVVY